MSSKISMRNTFASIDKNNTLIKKLLVDFKFEGKIKTLWEQGLYCISDVFFDKQYFDENSDGKIQIPQLDDITVKNQFVMVHLVQKSMEKVGLVVLFAKRDDEQRFFKDVYEIVINAVSHWNDTHGSDFLTHNGYNTQETNKRFPDD